MTVISQRHSLFAIFATTICAAFSPAAASPTESVVASFSGSFSASGPGGAVPVGALLQDPAQPNIFYGVTEFGGAFTQGFVCSHGNAAGCGTVYKLDINSGNITLLHSFDGVDDGANPSSSLKMDAQGNLYGTTSESYPTNGDHGTVFKISLNSNNAFQTIAMFTGTAGDGAGPSGNIVLNSDGTIVGSTQSGGSPGFGTIYTLTPQAGMTYAKSIVYNFAGPDGSSPTGVAAYGGKYFLTTYSGGMAGCGDGGFGCGTVLAVTPTAALWSSSIVHVFGGKITHDGSDPISPPLIDGSGALYVFTSTGGFVCSNEDPENAGCGGVVKFMPNDTKEHIIFAFSNPGLGASPNSLAFGPNGSLVGTFFGGGDYNVSCHEIAAAKCGTFYQLSPTNSGKYVLQPSSVYYLTGSPNGSFPAPSGLTQISASSFLDPTEGGGDTSPVACGPSSARRSSPCGAVVSYTLGQ